MPVAASARPLSRSRKTEPLVASLLDFSEFGAATVARELRAAGGAIVPVLVNEFWTAKQRAGHPLHEVSYRACFKPALPRFFIERLTAPGALVYDPFMGRGTTLVEAMLLGRRAAGCDVSPICRMLVEPRLAPPALGDVAARLEEISLAWDGEIWADLTTFFHERTLREITALRAYFLAREADGTLDAVDRWIRMVATNRLTGHSKGFFSVYTLPPNQAVTIASQQRINAQRKQTPEYRNVRALVLRKSKQLLSEPLPATATATRGARDGEGERALLMTGSCDATPALPDASVDLVVTSPPFLDVVDYVTDNWLRGWFCGVDTKTVRIWQLKKLDDWIAAMERVFRELHRVVRPGGWVAFEVGEVNKGTVRLEEHALTAGTAAGFEPVLILINEQDFTKTSNCWGVTNAEKGTNSNRVVVFRRV